jgi:hypothetical protein
VLLDRCGFFDPYFALSPVIEDVEIKEGWLNIYERYAL